MADYNYNKITIGGRLTKNPVLRVINSGVYVTTFNIATGETNDLQKMDAMLVRVTAWGLLAKFIVQNFRKGQSICVIGSFSSRFWIGCNGQRQEQLEIYAEKVFPTSHFSMKQASYVWNFLNDQSTEFRKGGNEGKR